MNISIPGRPQLVLARGAGQEGGVSAPLRSPSPTHPPQGCCSLWAPLRDPQTSPGDAWGGFSTILLSPTVKRLNSLSIPRAPGVSSGLVLTSLHKHQPRRQQFPKGSQQREGYEVSPIYLAASQLCLLQQLFPANILRCGMPAIFYKVNNFFLIG